MGRLQKLPLHWVCYRWLTLQLRWHQPHTQARPLCDPKVTPATNATPQGSSALLGSKELRQCSPKPLARSCLSQKHVVLWLRGPFPGEEVFHAAGRAGLGMCPCCPGVRRHPHGANGPARTVDAL